MLGLARDIVMAAVFGAGPALDAYLVSQGLMNIVLGLVAGAMAKSITPVVAREATGEDGTPRTRHAHPSFDVALSVTMVVLGLAGVVMWIFVAPVSALLAPGFSGDQADLTQSLTRIVLVATVLVAGTNLLASLTQAHNRYFWAAIQGVPFNLVMIVAAAVFGPQYGVTALAVGFVVGSATRLLLQLIPLRSLAIRVRPGWNLRDPGFREIAALVPALLVGSAIGNVNTLVDRAVGSTLAEGSITALSYGWRLVSLPETLLIASLLVPLYTAFGASARNRTEVTRLVGRGLAATVTILTPVCVILVVAAEPIVLAVFGYGAFDDRDAAAAATAVAWYAPALLALGFREVVVRASYAIGDARTPVTVALVAMALNVVGDIVLGPLYGIPGIAVSTTASIVLAAALNGWLLHRRHGCLAPWPTMAVLARAALFAAIATAAGLATRALLGGFDLPPILLAVALAAVIAAFYALGMVLVRAPERGLAGDVLRAIRRRRS